MKLYPAINYIYRLSPLKFIIAICILSIIANLILQIKSGNPSWDTDQFMYLGVRLLEGEFLWTVTYDDKLPIVQILFLLPAIFESVFIWFLISTTFVIFGSLACYILVNDILSKYSSITIKDRKLSGLLAAISMFYLSTFLPGTFYHINLASTSAAVISIALLVRSIQKNNKINTTLLVTSAFSASLSIGIRPFFFLALITAVFFLIFNHFRILKKKNEFLIKVFFWIFLVGLFGLLINVLPYILIGDLNAFFAGIFMMSQELNPQPIQHSFLNFIKGLFKQSFAINILTFFSIATVINILLKLIKYNLENFILRKILYDVIIIVLILPLCLLTLIVSKHFHTHYLQMFAPFIALGVGFFFVLFYKNLIKKLSKGSINSWLIAIVFVSISITPVFIKDLIKIKFNEEEKIEHHTYVSETISMQPEDQQDFLFLDDNRTHWVLAESRHGFPNGANTRHIILLDWWKKVIMPTHFGHPTNSEEYCLALENKGPSNIFVEQLQDFQTSCLYASTVFQFVKKLPNGVSLFTRH